MNSQLSAKNSANWSSRLFSIIESDVSARISRVFSALGEFFERQYDIDPSETSGGAKDTASE